MSNESVATLRKYGLGITKPRVVLLEFLLQSHMHVTAEQLYNSINKKEEIISLATIYNTLKIFVQKGLLNEVVVEPNRTYYDTNTAPHFHMFDSTTKELIDLYPKNKLPQDLVKELAKEFGLCSDTLNGAEIIFYSKSFSNALRK
ncbi:MAG: Fur family transcriptional regulator [Methylacidiphilales bacterium]|nr:Fur family transcriptional regulator [Candidatus Methylacidiphilales bacterium]